MAYTYSQLRGRINGGIKGKVGILVGDRELINSVARQVTADVDLRSMRRRTPMSPNLFSKVFEYLAPTDIKDYGIINITPQTQAKAPDYRLVPSEEFRRRQDSTTMAIEDFDLGRKILVNAAVNDSMLTISPLDSTTSGGGTWAGFGDGTNLRADTDQYVSEGGSLRWDISAAAGTTAGIVNTAVNSYNMTDYLQGNGAAFVWVYITSITNLTNFIIRLGDSASVYYQKTTTTQSDGTAFVAGWNLLRFDLTSLTTSGTPSITTSRYVAIYMTKTAAKVSETDYRFDSIVLRRGVVNRLQYYSKYPWVSAAGTRLENSTANDDVLTADTTEFELYVMKGIELAGQEVDEFDASDRAAKKYEIAKKSYCFNNPSEAQTMISIYADFIKM